MATVAIKNGRVITASDDYTADILIQDGRIHTIGRDLEVGGDTEVHDASGLLVFPGGVDVHTHLDWEFGVAKTVDTFGTGTMAAAFGGTPPWWISPPRSAGKASSRRSRTGTGAPQSVASMSRPT